MGIREQSQSKERVAKFDELAALVETVCEVIFAADHGQIAFVMFISLVRVGVLFILEELSFDDLMGRKTGSSFAIQFPLKIKYHQLELRHLCFKYGLQTRISQMVATEFQSVQFRPPSLKKILHSFVGDLRAGQVQALQVIPLPFGHNFQSFVADGVAVQKQYFHVLPVSFKDDCLDSRRSDLIVAQVNDAHKSKTTVDYFLDGLVCQLVVFEVQTGQHSGLAQIVDYFAEGYLGHCVEVEDKRVDVFDIFCGEDIQYIIEVTQVGPFQADDFDNFDAILA